MSSFLDSLANSWSGGYDVNEIERRRAMNNALMNLGTTLLMAGGSGSWRAAAPMLAQAVPSAMGAFQGSIQDAQKLRMMEEERAWQKEQREYTMAERKRIEDEREERKRKEGLDTQAASKQAEMLQSRLEEIYERGVNDEDISALPDGTKPDLEAFWNAGRTALESFYLTNDKSYLEPLETAVAQFGGQVNRSEDVQKAADLKNQAAAAALGIPVSAYLQDQRAEIASRRDARSIQADEAKRRRDEAALRDEMEKKVVQLSSANALSDASYDPVTGYLTLPDGTVGPAPKAYIQWFNKTKTEIATAERAIQKSIQDKLKINSSWSPSRTWSDRDLKKNDKRGGLSAFDEAAASWAKAFGRPVPDSPEALQADYFLVTSPEFAQEMAARKVLGSGAVAANPVGSAPAGGKAPISVADLTPEEKAKYDLLVKQGVSPERVLAGIVVIRSNASRQ